MGRNLKSDHFCSITFSSQSTFSAPLAWPAINLIFGKKRCRYWSYRVCHRRLTRTHAKSHWTVQERNICTANDCASTITIELRGSSMSRKIEYTNREIFSSRLRCSSSSLCDLIYLFAMAIEILIGVGI